MFGEHHMYPGSSKSVYQSIPFDPEGKILKTFEVLLIFFQVYYSLLVSILGILSTLTNVLLVYMGVHAGRIVLCYQYTNERIKRWVAWTIVLVS